MPSAVAVVFQGLVITPRLSVGLGYPIRRRIIATSASVMRPLIRPSSSGTAASRSWPVSPPAGSALTWDDIGDSREQSPDRRRVDLERRETRQGIHRLDQD